MIRSWKNDASRQLYWQSKIASVWNANFDAAVDLLLALNVARGVDDLHALRCANLSRKKSRKKRWMMMIDDRWHIRFDLRKGDAHDVKIVGESKSVGRTKTRRGQAIAPAIHPGRFLRRELAARQLSANRLSLDIGVPSGRIIDILNARRAISADTAVRIGRYLGTSAQFWCDLQSQFDIAVVELKKGAEIAKRVKAAS